MAEFSGAWRWSLWWLEVANAEKGGPKSAAGTYNMYANAERPLWSRLTS